MDLRIVSRRRSRCGAWRGGAGVKLELAVDAPCSVGARKRAILPAAHCSNNVGGTSASSGSSRRAKRGRRTPAVVSRSRALGGDATKADVKLEWSLPGASP